MALLKLEHTQTAFVNQLFGDDILFHCPLDSRNNGIGFAGQQQDINSCKQSANLHISFETILVPHAFHFHTICDNQTIIAQFFLQEIGDDSVRHGGNGIGFGIQSGNVQVTDHHHIRIFVDEIAIRIEFHLVQIDTVFVDFGKTVVRIRLCIAVTGIMLEGGDDAAILHPVHIEHGLTAHFVAVFAKGTAVNHRVTAVVIDVDAGGEVEVDADGLALFSNLHAHLVDERVVLFGKGAEGHLAGESHAAVESHGRTPFAVNGHEQRNFADGLQTVGEPRLPDRTAFEKADTARLDASHLFHQLLVIILVFGGTDPYDQQLRNLLFQCHLRKHVVVDISPLYTSAEHQQ